MKKCKDRSKIFITAIDARNKDVKEYTFIDKIKKDWGGNDHVRWYTLRSDPEKWERDDPEMYGFYKNKPKFDSMWDIER